MQKAGKIAIQSLKTLITGSNNPFGNALAKNLVQKGSTVYTVDKKLLTQPKFGENHHFEQGDLADESFLKGYLEKIGPVDALVNCAGYRSAYNYFLSYIVSKNILEKFNQNDTNEYGCRGCIVNLVYLSSQYTDEYFKKQDDFIEKYKINTETIDDDVYRLADLLTVARIRCNTLMVDAKVSEKQFTSMVTHILEDQYIAGQVINMEDNLRWQEFTDEEHKAELAQFRVKKHTGDQSYVPPPEMRPDPDAAPIALPLSSNSAVPAKS